MRLEYAPYILKFRQPAGTSRGVMTEKLTFIIRLYDEKDPTHFGIGEASWFKGLSAESLDSFGFKMLELLANVAIGRPTDLSRHSSLQFGFEQAIRDFSSGGRGLCFPSKFTEGDSDITINGLVWMGDIDTMLERIDEKLRQGFRCIKLKIGAIERESEIKMIRHIRETFGAGELTIRVDANGGFTPDDALDRLVELARYDIHSIEQPLKPEFAKQTAELCRVSPVAIALDEQLIGVSDTEAKVRMLEEIAPQYIILKPSLCGGFSGAEEWIALAGERSIGWWVTSALESNVGLDALAQWTAAIGAEGPQGLGTGALYTNNFESPIRLDGERLRYDASARRDNSQFDNLDWRY